MKRTLCLLHWLVSDLTWVTAKRDWAGLQSVGLVERQRTGGGKTTVEVHYYLSSLAGSGQQFGKVGRTTRYTLRTVFDVSADVKIEYDLGMLTFHDQILVRGNASPFSDHGDSGAVIVDQTTSAQLPYCLRAQQARVYAFSVRTPQCFLLCGCFFCVCTSHCYISTDYDFISSSCFLKLDLRAPYGTFVRRGRVGGAG